MDDNQTQNTIHLIVLVCAKVVGVFVMYYMSNNQNRLNVFWATKRNETKKIFKVVDRSKIIKQN